MNFLKKLFTRQKPKLSSIVQSLIELMEEDKELERVTCYAKGYILTAPSIYLETGKSINIDFNTGELSYHSILSDRFYTLNNYENKELFQAYKKYVQRKNAICSETEEIQDAIDCTIQKLKEVEG